MQGYWIYETSDIRYTSEKTIDNLLNQEVNFAVGFLKSNIDVLYTHKLGIDTSGHVELTLFYRGVLASNGGKTEKQSLRRAFHRQLAEFWKQNPLNDYRHLWDPALPLFKPESDIRQRRGPFEFVPLVNEYMYLVADLEIQLLRPEPPGSVKAQAGDLDNRMKTLLDALRMPRVADELPAGDSPGSDESPFFSLLEDDALINSFSVTTHRWLEPGISHKEAILTVSVQTAVTRLMARNSELAGHVI